MTDEKKRELFPYFAYLYSQEINPEKYGQVESIEDWSNLIQSNQADIEKITQAAEQMSDEDWDALDQQYTEQSKASEDPVISAKKGAKLMKLKNAAKKCKCGCEMITSKAEGGKLISKCACGCSMAKKEKGGEINKKIDKMKVSINKKQTGGDINQPSNAVAKKGMKVKPKMQNGGKYNESEHATLIEKYKTKKASESDTKRLQELNKTSGHHEDGWEPKKAKATITPKPKVDEKKAVDRIGKHKLGGSIQKFWGGGPTSSLIGWNKDNIHADPIPKTTPKTPPNYPEDDYGYYGGYPTNVATSVTNGFLTAPINYLTKTAARGFNRLMDEAEIEARDYVAAQSKPSVKVPVTNPRANPAPARIPASGSQNSNLGFNAIRAALSGPMLFPVNLAAGMWADKALSAPNPQRPGSNAQYASEFFSPGVVDERFSNMVGGYSPNNSNVAPRTAPSTQTAQVIGKPEGSQSKTQASPAYDTNTLWGWMKSTGTGDASYGGRRDLWNKFYGSTGGSAYTGTADQNTRLLEAMKKANTMGVGIEKAAAYTNIPSLKAPAIKKIDPTKKLESKNPEVKKPETKEPTKK